MTEPKPASPDDERPPLLGSWPRVYALIIGWLAVCIAGLAWLTVAF